MHYTSYARQWVAATVAITGVCLALTAGATDDVDDQLAGIRSYDDLVAVAERLAGGGFAAARWGEPVVGAEAAGMGYDLHRLIRFDPNQAVWKDQASRFQVQMHHLGGGFTEPVRLFVVESQQTREIVYDPAQFIFRPPLQQPEWAKAGLGFAGFRVHSPINTDYFDEVASFCGASYYRLVGRGQVYGASARGVAIDTASELTEQFPSFRAFWLTEPADDGPSLTILALLDGPAIAGAYEMVLGAEDRTVLDVRATLWLRSSVGKLGLAPLTSMYWFDKQRDGGVSDYRRAVHDSDGLLLVNGDGERLWRPLRSRPELLVERFALASPQGFGLLQRSTAFADYGDLEANYDRRPGLWVEPVAGFDRGSVELVQLPTAHEYMDNVVAMWVPDALPPVGERIELHYRVSTVAGLLPGGTGGGRVVATWREPVDDETVRYLVDFAGVPHPSLEPSANVTADGGVISSISVSPNPHVDGWRVAFEVKKWSTQPVLLRLFLRRNEDALSETWTESW